MDNQRSINELVEEFVSTMDHKGNTRLSYVGNIRRFAKYLEDKNITHPTEADLIKYKNNYLSKKVRSATIQKYVIVVRKFFRWCSRHGYYSDISQVLTGEKIKPTFKRESLTLEQVKKLLHKAKIRAKKSVKNYRDYAIVYLILVTGLRTIEVARADVDDIGQINGVDVLYIQGKGHSDKDDFVKLPKQAKELIDTYLKIRNSDSDALFVNHGNHVENERIDTKTISLSIKTLLRMVGIDDKKFTAHSLRHTCATLALKNGASIQEVQMLLRHKSLNTTTIYAHNLDRISSDTEYLVDEVISKKR